MWKFIKKLFGWREGTEKEIKKGKDKKYPLDFFYPEAMFIPELPLLKTRYKWNGLPKVFVIHFTAGWNTRKGIDFMKSFLKRGLCTYFMDRDGQIWQQHHGNTGGYHAGKSKWNGKTSISRFAGGIEIACGGKLKQRDNKFFTWFNKEIKRGEWRKGTKEQGYMSPGFYECYTPAQEKSLARFCTWLKKNGVEEFVGHDMVSPGRKNDPGSSLSKPLPQWIKENVK